MRPSLFLTIVGVTTCLLPDAGAATPTPKAIVDSFLEHDFWGLAGAQVEATILLKDKKGRQRTLTFEALSRKYKGTLTKSLVRLRSPPDLAGSGFLQIQNDTRDDDRFLYLPELKRVRRVAGNQRSTAFMGTDFSFADLDKRDMREGTYKAGPDTKVGKFDCYQVVVTCTRSDSPYSKMELIIRKENFVLLVAKLFDRAGVHIKTLSALHVKKVEGRWFIIKSQMVSHKEGHSTTLHLEKIVPKNDIPDSRFTQDSLAR